MHFRVSKTPNGKAVGPLRVRSRCKSAIRTIGHRQATAGQEATLTDVLQFSRDRTFKSRLASQRLARTPTGHKRPLADTA
jgi:hypothetical protein